MHHLMGLRLIQSVGSYTTGARGPVLAGLLSLAGLVACAGSPGVVTPEPSGTDAEAQGGAATETAEPDAERAAADPAPRDEPAEAPAGAEEEDGEWKVDEEGRRYREHRLPKVENHYRISPDGGTVFLPPGLRYDLVRVEEDAFVVKQYDPADAEERRRRALEEGPAAVEAESRAETAALEAEIGEADRLELVRFDDGLPKRGQWRQGFAVVDLDGDGHLDIVHGPPRKSANPAPVAFLGDSQGSWRRWRKLRYEGPTLDYGDVAVADFDGDGHLDLAFAVHLRGILIARGDGEGSFTRWKTEGLDYRVPGQGQELPPYSTRTVEVVDWNRDGRPDLLTLSEGPRMSRDRGQPGALLEGVWGVGLYLNRGDGRWERQEGETLPNAPFGDDVAVGDFDGDGRPDFANAVHAVGSKGILHMQRADGTYEQRHFEPLPIGMPTAVAAADFDGDGRDDLAVGMTTTPATADDPALAVVALFLSREDGAWERRILAAEEGRISVWALAAGDLDGDDRTDLVALTGDGQRWVFLGTSEGDFVRERSPELAPGEPDCRGYEARLIDLNGDGRDEAILAFAGEAGLEQQLDQLARAGGLPQCASGGSLEVWALAPPEAGE